jgi:hypothetical protein
MGEHCRGYAGGELIMNVLVLTRSSIAWTYSQHTYLDRNQAQYVYDYEA